MPPKRAVLPSGAIPPPPPVYPGARVYNYIVEQMIGEGGMGMVYLGVHPQIGKRVAIKVLHEELSSKADVVSRFFTEARNVCIQSG